MKAFHGKQEIKDEYIKRLQEHYDADEIVKGVYWEDGKGCAVGCTLHSGDHKAYEVELGIPEVLARLEDSIFEGLSPKDAKEFPLNFLNAVNVGSDLSQVGDKFLHWLLVDPKHGVIKYATNKKVVQDVADLYESKINGEKINRDVWAAARVAAADTAAARAAAADAAAYGAARAAYGAAYGAARAAYGAAAYGAAVASGASTADAGYAATRLTQAEKLIELISYTIA